MIEPAPSEISLRDDHLLPVAELLHRVRNEYARAIGFASAIAARSSSNETKAALREMTSQLHAAAEIHNVLQPPIGEGLADLTEVISRLCCAFTDSSEFQHRGIKLELCVESPVLIDARRSWRASLVVAELIYNSCRHAFASRSGSIFVTVRDSYHRVFCSVADDGSPAEVGGAGLGARITDALAAELDGLVERRFSGSGATVTLSFPKRAQDAVLQSDEHPVGRRSHWPSHDLSPVVDGNSNPF